MGFILPLKIEPYCKFFVFDSNKLVKNLSLQSRPISWLNHGWEKSNLQKLQYSLIVSNSLACPKMIILD